MIINESGFFWLSDAKEGERPVAGQLTVDDNGIIELELHQTFTRSDAFEATFHTKVHEREVFIVGHLKKSNKNIILKNIKTNGSQISTISYVNYVAELCLVSTGGIDTEDYKAIRIPLKNLNQWSYPGEFKHDNEKELNSTININLKETNSWQLDGGTLSLKNHLEGTKPNRHTIKLNISITSHFWYERNTTALIDDFLDFYRGIQDLLMVIINDKASVDWPVLYCEDGANLNAVECYFRRDIITDNTFSWIDVIIPFPRIKNDFGSMVSTWFEKRKTLGPSVNLYLSTLRNKNSYVENTFVNMVWGLESLDRRYDSSSDISVKSKLDEKIERISKTIKENKILSTGDCRWLMKALTRNNERSLAERLYSTFSRLNLHIDEKKLRFFCETCANLRNDLSHHGGERTPGEYDNFINKLIPHSSALSTLYLFVMLDILKITNEELNHIVLKSPNSYKYKATLINVGLLDNNP